MPASMTESPVAAAAPASSSQSRTSREMLAGKYLTFRLGREEFAIPVLMVREIMGIEEITAVPHTPPHIKGVINLRGKVIPVVDLRLKFGLPELEYTPRTCIIVIQVAATDTTTLMGVVVDGVSEVVNLAGSDIENTPEFGIGVTTPYLMGMAKLKGKVKILLDINQILTSQELFRLDSIPGEGQ